MLGLRFYLSDGLTVTIADLFGYACDIFVTRQLKVKAPINQRYDFYLVFYCFLSVDNGDNVANLCIFAKIE